MSIMQSNILRIQYIRILFIRPAQNTKQQKYVSSFRSPSPNYQGSHLHLQTFFIFKRKNPPYLVYSFLHFKPTNVQY